MTAYNNGPYPNKMIPIIYCRNVLILFLLIADNARKLNIKLAHQMYSHQRGYYEKNIN